MSTSLVRRRRRRRVIQDINSENTENIPILTTEQVDALNAELTPDGAARKILAELQENVQRLTGEKRELNAELATRKRARTRSVRVIKQTEDDFGVGDAAQFFTLNRWAFITNTAWLADDPLNIPDEDPTLEPHLLPKKQLLLDYLNVLPTAVKEDHQEFAVRSIFLTDMGNMRSQKVHDVKEAAHKIWDRDLANYIQQVRSPGSTVDSSQAKLLLGFNPRNPNDPNSKDSYSIKPPFMLGDGNGLQTERLFRVEALAKVARLLIFGKSSLNGPSVANNDTYGKMWGLSEVTAPLIAFTTVLVNYLLSSDREFTPNGKYTRMEYGSRYARYRAWAARLSTYAAGRETLKFWNDIVFAGYTRNNGLDTVEASDGNDIMQELSAVAAAEEAALALELEIRNAGVEGNGVVDVTGTVNDTGANGGIASV